MKLKSLYHFFFSFFLLFFFFLVISFVHIAYAQVDQIYIPSVTPYFIKRIPYETASSGAIFAKGGKHSQTSSGPALSLGVIGPALGGLASVLGGSLFATLKLKKKKKLFNAYMKRISDAEKAYEENKTSGKKDAIKTLRETLDKIQQEAELDEADKKIDDDQRTAITHKIQRKFNDPELSSATKA